MQTFPTPEPAEVVVRCGAGRVSVTTHEAGQTSVRLTGLDASGEEAAARAEVRRDGDSILVDVPRRGGPQVDVAISCPPGSTLRVEAEAADVRATGTYQSVDLATGSGDVTVETVSGPARLGVGSGDIVAGRVDGPLSARTGSGDVTVDSSAGAQVIAGSGDVSIGYLRGEAVTKTGSGDVEIGVLEGTVVSKSGSGDLAVRRATSGSLRATSASGAIDVGVADGTAAWLDLSTVSGRVEQQLGDSDGPREDQQRVEIVARTVSGDVRIRRA